MSPFPAKFCHLNSNGDHVPHDYGNTFFAQPCGNYQRLVIGPSSGHVELLTALAAEFATQQFYVLYVLLLSHSGNLPGRYQSPPVQSLPELQTFLNEFGSFIENDGRHHLWVGSIDGSSMLVYDQHNVIFVYGSLPKYQAILEARGYTKHEFWFPTPHSHSHSPGNADTEDRLLAYFPSCLVDLESVGGWKIHRDRNALPRVHRKHSLARSVDSSNAIGGPSWPRSRAA